MTSRQRVIADVIEMKNKFRRELVTELNSLIIRSAYCGEVPNNKENRELMLNSIKQVALLLDLNVAYNEKISDFPLFTI